MKGTKDAWTMCINQCIVNGWLFRASGYDQEISQSQTADKPMTPRGRVTKQSRDTRKTN